MSHKSLLCVASLVVLMLAPQTPVFAEEKEEPRWGLGVRGRINVVPTWMLEAFWFDRAGSFLQPGLGLELSWGRKNFQIVFGVQYDNLAADEGYYQDKGDDIAMGETPDYVTFDGFSMYSADITFVWSAPIVPGMDFRYGVGLGAAVIFGELLKEESTCDADTSLEDLDDPMTTKCSRVPGSLAPEEDIPGVLPVVHALVGLGFNLGDDFLINLDVGIRDLPFVGVGAAYQF